MTTPPVIPPVVTDAASGTVGAGGAGATDRREQELQQIRDALRGLRFGSINVIVQDGVVVQIDRTEKRRLRQNDSRSN